MPAKKGTKKKTEKKDIVEAAPEEVKAKKDEIIKDDVKQKVVEKLKEEIKSEAVAEESENDDFNGESESLNIVERFVRFETETKIGIIASLVLFFAIIFSWDWINTTWWLILIIAAVSLKTLHSQTNDLEEDKPFESKMSRLFFIGTMILLVIRDLVITSRLDNWLDYIK
ncbi:MAG: hypothetical protein PF638_12155 [Candidatus Delongbacteria bacterium]|jgi:hypothetical protein|nr:hypothetical protein [Candidatus Delongbacteria bacterium]